MNNKYPRYIYILNYAVSTVFYIEYHLDMICVRSYHIFLWQRERRKYNVTLHLDLLEYNII